ncbi:MAG: low molecular weight phosphotyrosine protein phosphatase [Clostridia bacterium]|nr:low molecular weight phosphotyrosine protein phosphatase [Clostridia bacterium]
MKKILFVCHGNICRSPLAEYIFRDMASEAGVDIAVASAATSGEEIWGGVGNPVYPPVKKLLAARGIDCSDKRATRLEKRDYDAYDLIVVMDGGNRRDALRILGGDSQGKVRLLMEFAGLSRDVADPWYTRDFAAAERDIEAGCRGLLRAVRNGEI